MSHSREPRVEGQGLCRLLGVCLRVRRFLLNRRAILYLFRRFIWGFVRGVGDDFRFVTTVGRASGRMSGTACVACFLGAMSGCVGLLVGSVLVCFVVGVLVCFQAKAATRAMERTPTSAMRI